MSALLVALTSLICPSEQLCAMKSSLLQGLETHRAILGRLEDLDEMMTAMLSEQQTVQHDVEALLETLESRLVELENLENAYVAYRRSYAHLLQEMVRRERHRAEMEEIVHGMLERLDRYREGEPPQASPFVVSHICRLSHLTICPIPRLLSRVCRRDPAPPRVFHARGRVYPRRLMSVCHRSPRAMDVRKHGRRRWPRVRRRA